jgi:hypothetical protein
VQDGIRTNVDWTYNTIDMLAWDVEQTATAAFITCREASMKSGFSNPSFTHLDSNRIQQSTLTY